MSNNHINNSIEFLLFVYFNLDLSYASDFDKALDASIKKAFEDATSEGAFNTLYKTIEDSNLKESIKKASKKAYKEATSKIIKCINCLLNNNINYDDWHNYLCKTIIFSFTHYLKDYKVDFWFTYGNAQKWVNMTMKYLYIIAGCLEVVGEIDIAEFDKERNKTNKKKWKAINEIYKYFHVPVDSYIIESVWNKNITEETKNTINLPNIKFTSKKGVLGAYSSEKYKAWSKWDNEEYDNFQKILFQKAKLDKKHPIEWESKTWINQSKNRKNK